MNQEELLKLDETRARAGAGSGLYIFDNDLGKYKAFLPTTKLPFIKKDVSELDVKVINTDVVGKTNGTSTLSSSETTFYMHRDNINILKELNGKVVQLLSMLSDFVGQRYDAKITYTYGEVEQDSLAEGTLKITPISDPVEELDCFPLVIPTASFKSAIPATVFLESMTSKHVLNVVMKNSGATFTATSSDATVATAEVAGNMLTITGKAKGTATITLESKLEGFAPWKTSVYVVVPAASTPSA